MSGSHEHDGQHEHSDFVEKLKHPFHDLKEKLKDTHLYDAKVSLIHKKHKLGKLGNLFNPEHRHDEEHEKACDEKRNRISKNHRFNSYFPEHDGNLIKWYVDGRDYFWAVSVALEQAKETIYIADWWLSPELFLRRPPYFNQEWRLDRILKRRAEAGVKIYVIVYREVEAALTCNSEHTKHALQSLCPEGSPGYGNIKVMRHPDHNFLENAADMTFYWAHHEKFVVIDYAMAFIGGLDLCFGRWDDHQHILSDVHPEGVANEVWPGQDFNNNRVMDFQNVQDWKQNELSKADYGRMPWHDVAMGVIGPCVYDIAEHFVLRWNFIKRDKYKRDDRFDWLMLRGREGDDEDLVGVQRPKHPVGDYVLHPLSPLESKNLEGRGTIHAQIVRSSADWSSGVLTDCTIASAYSEIIRNAQHYVYIENQFFITATGDQQSPIHNTVGKAIVDACVRAGREGRKFRVIIVIPAIPGFAGDLRDDAATGTRAIMDYQYKSICRGEHSIFEQIRVQGVNPRDHIFFFNLRSYDRLNKTPAIRKQEEVSGVKYQEVQRAEAEEIMGEGIHGIADVEGERDEHMGKREQQKEIAENTRSNEAKRRFEEAKQDGQDTQSASSVAHHAMIDTGMLSEEPWEGDPHEEVDNWIQEELYVHAKLLIVDDRTVICGSSNLNDRSQLGSHDSELSIVMEDADKIQSVMDGQPFSAGRHAATLRRYLWREHLGLLPPQQHDASNDPNAQPPGENSPNDIWDRDDSYKFVEDPMSDKLWDMWTTNATTNTQIFRHLFHADPDDHVKTFEDYNTFLPPKGVKAGHIFDRFLPPDDIRKKLDQIKGHLVWMPLDYLKDANMAETGLQVNSWTESVYT
ncbi:phospholipase D/nuclease [Annulohypoxylon maeteangense]|uniref:phospholipase D/nuclease n=1 Tax=Annulohypoxylon maeteangense TaxID=1927788 RepID=UPI002008DE41|nr:phospholipase D/nuclease [Annulohypoxylon maeteangense]KAI0889509.1 phospholipase D/nuclease [Annulohypoxylon maeteangense]